MKRPTIHHLPRGPRPLPRAVEAANRAIDAVLGRKAKAEWPKRGEMEQVFRDARKG